jgi:hypothetical protein
MSRRNRPLQHLRQAARLEERGHQQHVGARKEAPRERLVVSQYDANIAALWGHMGRMGAMWVDVGQHGPVGAWRCGSARLHAAGQAGWVLCSAQ